MSEDKINSEKEPIDQAVNGSKPKKPLEADYGDATPEDVALALLRYRRDRREGE